MTIIRIVRIILAIATGVAFNLVFTTSRYGRQKSTNTAVILSVILALTTLWLYSY